MFQPIKDLFSKLSRKQPPASAPVTTAPPPSRPAPAAKETKPAPPPPRAAAPAAAPASAPQVPPAVQETPGVGEETFALPLKVVLSRLPASLAASVKSTGGGDLQLPLKKVLAQLPQGSVKISFGELRQASPPGTFLEVASQDSTLIELPLPEIVSRINPSLISRRQDQKTIEVPPEVGNVFGPRGETVAPAPDMTTSKPVAANPAAPKPAAPAVAPIPAPAAAPAPKPILPTAPSAPIPSSASLPKPAGQTVPKPPAPALPKPAPTVPPPPPAAPKVAAPAVPQIPKPPTSSPSLPKPPAPAVPAPSAPIAAPKLPSAPAMPKPPGAPAAPAPAPVSAPAPVVAAPVDQTQFFLEKEAVTETGNLIVPLSSLIGAWPEPVKQEITQHGLADSSVALPMASVESGLKSGKIVFSWREIGAWLQPKPMTSTPNGDTLVELPLKVVAPLFIAQHKPAKTQRKVAIGENIPDIFSGAAPAPKPSVAVPKPAIASPAPVAAAPAPAPALPTPPAAPSIAKPQTPAVSSPAAPVAPMPTTLGDVFGEPDKKDWTPREIAQKSSLVKGLAGSVISTHDGLMVAGELPAPMKADMIAAFLPQIFSRLNQYSKELQTGGDVSTMTITFDKVPWQFSKLGKIYFAAVGRPGEPLPSAQLSVICGELAKQNK